MKKTFKDYDITMESLKLACSNIIGKDISSYILGDVCGITKLHSMAIEKAFVYNIGSPDDHYVLRVAKMVLDEWGWYERG